MRLLPLLYAHPGRAAELAAFEDRALAVVSDYGTVERHRAPVVVLGGGGDGPDEVHLVAFRDAAAFAAYSADIRTGALAAARDAAILRTTVLQLE